jgi:ribosomal protein S11
MIKNPKKFFLLYLNITKNNFKVSIIDSKGRMCFKKSEGMLKGIRKGSINSADTSLLMMNALSIDIKELGIENLGIYLKGATRWKKLSLRRLFNGLKASNI